MSVIKHQLDKDSQQSVAIDGDEIWVHQTHPSTKEVAIVIPFYNELSNPNFQFTERLTYYQSLAHLHRNRCDLFLVDDGSTDGSQEELKKFIQRYPEAFNVIALRQNRQKVGAVKIAISKIEHEYVFTSDFDTDLVGLEKMGSAIRKLKDKPDYMGSAFRVVPCDGSGILGKYYLLESYSTRVSNDVLQKEDYVTGMYGAASLYRREVFQRILAEHSGRFCGDDLESTIIGFRLGYKAFYESDIHAVTRTPKDFLSVHKQKSRWKQGFLEVILKERAFVWHQIREGTRFGERMKSEIWEMIMLLSFPLMILLLFVINPLLGMMLFLAAYLYYEIDLLLWVAKEGHKMPDKRPLTIVPILPILWLLIETPTWIRAIYRLATSFLLVLTDSVA